MQIILAPILFAVIKGFSMLLTWIATVIAAHRTEKKFPSVKEDLRQPTGNIDEAQRFISGPGGACLRYFAYRQAGWRFAITAGLIDGGLLLFFIASQLPDLIFPLGLMMLMFSFIEFMIYHSTVKALKQFNRSYIPVNELQDTVDAVTKARRSLAAALSIPRWHWLLLTGIAGAVAVALIGLQVRYCFIPIEVAPGIREVRGYQYRMMEDGCAELVGYQGLWTRIRMPDTLGGAPVTAIGENAFDDPSGDYHIFGRKKLESIRLPAGLKRIGAKAFSGSWQVKQITIPNSVSFIGDGAFSGSAIRDLTLPMSLMTVGEDPFKGVYVHVPEGHPVFHVREGALLNHINGTLVHIDPNCLDNRTEYAVPEGTLRIGGGVFASQYKLERVILPEGLREIGPRAFKSCDNLTGIILPDSVEMIGEEAFRSCNGLTEIRLPARVTAVPKQAFWYCNHLETVILPDGLTAIGEEAFSNCEALTEISLPDSVTSIGREAFRSCDNLRQIVLPSGLKEIGENAFAYTGIRELTVPSGVREIKKRVFGGMNVTSVTFSEGVLRIRASAFTGSWYIERLVLPASLVAIEHDAFTFFNSPPLCIVPRGSYAEAWARGIGCKIEYSEE